MKTKAKTQGRRIPEPPHSWSGPEECPFQNCDNQSSFIETEVDILRFAVENARAALAAEGSEDE